MSKESQAFDFALLLDGGGGATELDENAVANWSASDGVLWVDCDQNHRHAREWLQNRSGTERNVVDILLAGETRPRSISESDGMVVVVRGINTNPGAVPDDMVAVRIWLEEGRIITSHRRTLLSIGDVREALLARKGPKTVGGFLVMLVSCLAGRIGTAIDNLEQILDSIEAEVDGGNVTDLRTRLGSVRRQIAAVRRHLAPQRDALERIVRDRPAVLTDKEVYELREESDRLMRQVEDLDLARENGLVVQEELMNRVAQEQNSRMYLLSVVAAVFLPLTFVTGLLGMNVAGLPGTEDPRGFLTSAVVMVVLGIGLLFYFRWKKWI